MKYIAISTVALLVFLRAGLADPPPQATTNPVEPQMQKWWDDLEKREPECSRALLQFADHPAESVAFFAERLKPLKITEDEVKSLISDLQSDEPNIWKPAFEKLRYFDPRLAIDLSTLMSDNVKPRSRNRLIEILCGYDADYLSGKSIKLMFTGNGYNFISDGSAWWAEPHIEWFNNGAHENSKPQWARACRAIVLLEHIGSPEAITILRDMSTGHPDAKPTKAAAEALENIQALRK
jgi:hypothetical protein